MRLTKKLIEALDPQDAEYFVWDDAVSGFGVRVHPTGKKVYLLRYRTTSGTQRKLTIGNATSMGLDQARDKAREAVVAVASGKDPTHERRTLRASDTLLKLKDAYLEARQGHIKPQSAALYESYWKHHIGKPLGGMKVADISALDIQKLHSSLSSRPYEANRVLGLLKAMLNYAEKMKVIPRGTNPAYDVDKFREEPRQTILKPSDVQRLLAVLDVFKTRTWSSSYLVKVLLLTGLRRNEWAKARWEWIDLEAATLSLPDTKTGKRVVYLSKPVVDTLIDLRRRSRGEWVFPNEHGTGPITHVARQWARIQQAAGLSGIRIHDLRHTVGSLGHRAGLSQRQIADIMGHRNLQTTARYIHDGIDPHEVSNKASAVMLGQIH